MLAGLSMALGLVIISTLCADRFLSSNGYSRCSTVMEPGDYAVRGGIIDLFAPGSETPAADLFGDTLESIRPFEPESQRTIGQLSELTLTAAGEIHLDEEPFCVSARLCASFRHGDERRPLYAAISDGARHQAWSIGLPLFHDTLETLFDHCGRALYRR